MYESMKPARAGEIFNAMEPAFAAGFLTQMNRENAALVLANMDTQKAYAASIIIAGRNAAVNSR
jgi:flagellar motility protein MotE (MotC chaperone)